MSTYTEYDKYVITAFGLFQDLRLGEDIYSVLFEKKLHPNSEKAFYAAKDKSKVVIAKKCSKATPKQVEEMANVVLHLASQCRYVH